LNSKKIKKLVSYLKRKYKTGDPEEIADYLGVTIIRAPLEDVVAGFYKLLKRRKYIFLNSDIDDAIFLRVVLAHELGHAVMHPKENCAFMKNSTLLLTSRIEKQANIFAAHLLIDNELLKCYVGCTKNQFCKCTGYPEELLDLRLK
jgi:Zn-dependent peptidase ImmA (M78 family)